MLPSLAGLRIDDDGVDTGPKVKDDVDRLLRRRERNSYTRDERQRGRLNGLSVDEAGIRGYEREDETDRLSFVFKRYENKIMSAEEGAFYTRQYSNTSEIARVVEALEQWAYSIDPKYLDCGSSNCFVTNPPLSILYPIVRYIQGADYPDQLLTLRVINVNENYAPAIAHYRELVLTAIAAVEGIGPRVVAIVPLRGADVVSYVYIFEAGWTQLGDFIDLKAGKNEKELLKLGGAIAQAIQKASSRGFVLGDIKPGNAIARRVYTRPDDPTYEVACIDFDTGLAARRTRLSQRDLKCIAMINFVLFMNVHLKYGLTIQVSVTALVLSHFLKSIWETPTRGESPICDAINRIDPTNMTKYNISRTRIPLRAMTGDEFQYEFARLFWNRVVHYCTRDRWEQIRRRFGGSTQYSYMDALVREYISLGGMNPDIPSIPLQMIMESRFQVVHASEPSSAPSTIPSSGTFGDLPSSASSSSSSDSDDSDDSDETWFGRTYGAAAQAAVVQAYSDSSLGLPPLAPFAMTAESMASYLSQVPPAESPTSVETPLGVLDYIDLAELEAYATEQD
jgi:hypothetical protein